MKHSVPHDLGRDRAKKVAMAAWQSYSERFSEYSPTAHWRTEHLAEIGFKAKGISLQGSIEVKELSIDLELSVPFILKPFKKQAIAKIEEKIQDWIAKSKAGEI